MENISGFQNMGMPKRALEPNVEDVPSIKRSRKSDESNEVSTSVSGNSNHFSVKMKLTHSDQSDEEQVKNVAVKKNVITAASKLDEFTKIPGLQNISEDIFKLLDKKSLLNCRLVNSSWKKIIQKPIFLLKKLRFEDISLDNHNMDVQKYWIKVAREINHDDQIKQEFVLILLKIFKEKEIPSLEYFMDLTQAKMNRAAKYGQLHILKFLVKFTHNTMSEWIHPTVPTKTVVDHETETIVQKFSLGQQIINVTRANRTTISVKLPETGKYEYWCTIKVDGSKDESIEWPKKMHSHPASGLKVSVLRQAVGLANAAATTVRIPIENCEPNENFGVFAIPGLHSHVFLGPFTKQNLRDPFFIAAEYGHLDVKKYLFSRLKKYTNYLPTPDLNSPKSSRN